MPELALCGLSDQITDNKVQGSLSISNNKFGSFSSLLNKISTYKVRPFSVCSSDTLLACALAGVGQFLRLWFFKEGFSV